MDAKDLPAPCCVVTLGGNGCVVVTKERRQYLSGHAVVAVDTTGAGDCFAGFFVSALACGKDYFSAARLANAAAALSVTREGGAVSMPSADEARAFLRE